MLSRSWYGLKKSSVYEKNIKINIHVTDTSIPFALPLRDNVNITVDWGDGTIENTTDDVKTHSYSTADGYTIKITGTADKHYIYGNLNDDQRGMIMSYPMFDNLNFKYVNFDSAYNMTYVNFNNNIDTSSITNMQYFFRSCHNLTTFDLSNFNTSNVTDMSFMFYGCDDLNIRETLDLTNFDTGNVLTMNSMFAESNFKHIDVSNFSNNVLEDTGHMFEVLENLETLNLTNFNTSNVTDMNSMFVNLFSLTSLNVSSFDTSNVTNMMAMFNSCTGITALDLSNFNTSNVTRMDGMFAGINNIDNLDLSSFNTNNVITMMDMFSDFKGTTINLTTFNTSNTTNVSRMFYNCTSLTTTMDADIFWNNCDITSHDNTFKNATHISNYADIPETWGGPVGVEDPCGPADNPP